MTSSYKFAAPKKDEQANDQIISRFKLETLYNVK